MATRGVLLQAFYNQFFALTTELREMFPEDPDFALFENALRMIQKTNPGLGLVYYKRNVLETQFAEKIAAKDESFFLNYTYDEYQENVGGADVIGKLKQYWSVLSPDSHVMVWQHITMLDQLARHLTKMD